MIALGSDHVGNELKRAIVPLLEEMGREYRDYGAFGDESSDYPLYGYKAARAVASGECALALLFCGTGVGISITANKVRGVRCVNCTEPYSALLARQHNDANALALGSRVLGPELANMIVQTFLEGEFQGGRHARRVGMINQVDETGELAE